MKGCRFVLSKKANSNLLKSPQDFCQIIVIYLILKFVVFRKKEYIFNMNI
jgi:hypothetical protein